VSSRPLLPQECQNYPRNDGLFFPLYPISIFIFYSDDEVVHVKTTLALNLFIRIYSCLLIHSFLTLSAYFYQWTDCTFRAFTSTMITTQENKSMMSYSPLFFR